MIKHFPIMVEQDSDGIYIVDCPVLKGCRSYGNNIDEAISNIREAIELCIEDESYSNEEGNVFLGVRDVEMVV